MGYNNSMKQKLADILPVKPSQFQQRVLAWFDQHGRKSLPWQLNKTPYRVWVSEIMLQQTQVSTAIPYFERFLAQLPDVQSLAAATEDEVLHLWTGLGYYSRARNLHRTAKIVTQDFQGQFPNDIDLLQTLPGIGRSTAGAIMALAFEARATILDGNVKRVLTRVAGILEWPGEKKALEALWEIAEEYTPTKRIADYTQAMMDLGATLCVRSRPRCPDCPLQKNCAAHLQGIENLLPKKKKTVALPTREVTLLVLLNKQHVLLEKRPSPGIWGGLWSLPEIAGTPSQDQIQEACETRFGYKVSTIRTHETFRHTFSHFHLDISPAFIKVNTSLKTDTQIWYNLHEPITVGLPAPIKALLQRIQHESSCELRETSKTS